ncbi:MAG: tetratricopeptide repeat protein [Candidatus Riflebacteria bacterium]|nr:tetratricopeptide repeat protein [Candidatus Riflebacteria bacterium]
MNRLNKTLIPTLTHGNAGEREQLASPLYGLGVYIFMVLLQLVSSAAFAQEMPFSANREDPFFLYNQAMNDYSMRRLDSAKEGLEAFLKQFPNHQLTPRVNFQLATIYLDQRNPEKAIEMLTQIANTKENTSERFAARKSLITALSDLQRFRVAIENLEKWRAEEPDNIELCRSLADMYLQSGKSDEARFLLEGLLEKTANAQVFSDLLTLAKKSGQIESLKNSIEQRRVRYKTVDYLEFISSCLIAMKKDDEAVKILRETAETQNSPLLLQKLARLDLDRAKYENALESYRRLSVLGLNDWENAKAIGHCLILLNKKSEAIAEWRKPLNLDPRNMSNINYQNNLRISIFESYNLLTQALIEHKLYEEALSTFSEARKALGNPAHFAAERAGVLEAMARFPEALEEYFLALTFGNFTLEIFDKLYNPKNSGFDFKNRLKKGISDSGSISLKKALVELYFRRSVLSEIAEILELEQSDDVFDELLEERILQSNSSTSVSFTRTLMLELIAKKRSSAMGFRLSSALLELPEQTDAELTQARAEVEKTLEIVMPPDILIKSSLLGKFAEFLFSKCNDSDSAVKRASEILLLPETLNRSDRFEAYIIISLVEASRGNFDKASQNLSNARKIAGGEEETARLLVHEARIAAYKGDFQESLNSLKKLTDEYSDSMWLNDGLSLALFITAHSGSSLDTVKLYFDAERASLCGMATEAVKIFAQVASMASGTLLAPESTAGSLIAGQKISPPDKLLKDIQDFVALNPAHHRVPDLILLQVKLMKKLDAKPDEIADKFKEFLDKAPGDLRVRKVSAEIESLMKNKLITK